MRLFLQRLVWTFVLGAVVILSPALRAQKASEEVQFDTADKVEIHGSFYAPGKSKAPCVLLLHKLGGSRDENGWDQLARALQKDYAVLRFDFRGHGDSTNIGPGFWRYPSNALIKGSARMPQKISYKDFLPGYLPVLANDVAAARRYLDTQNDAGVCNSANIIVIGAEEGAAIGALWIASEWERRRLTKSNFGQWIVDPSRVEGESVAAAVWLSIPRTLSGVSVGFWLRGPANRVRDKVAMAFFYGDKDQKASAAAQASMSELRLGGREKPDFTKLRAKDTRLAGAELLGKSTLNTEDEIAIYLEKVMQKRGAKPYVKRDVEGGPQLAPISLSRYGFNLRP
jgi:pimeloyl-ACP methyl ester carboxylesterase